MSGRLPISWPAFWVPTKSSPLPGEHCARGVTRRAAADFALVTTSSKEKLDHLKSLPLGPTTGINYREEDFSEVILGKTNGEGVDVVSPLLESDAAVVSAALTN